MLKPLKTITQKIVFKPYRLLLIAFILSSELVPLWSQKTQEPFFLPHQFKTPASIPTQSNFPNPDKKPLLVSVESIMPVEKAKPLKPTPRIFAAHTESPSSTTPDPRHNNAIQAVDTHAHQEKKIDRPVPNRHILTLSAGLIKNETPTLASLGNGLAGTGTFSYEGITRKTYQLLRLHAGVSIDAYQEAGTNFFIPDSQIPYQTFRLRYGSLFNVHQARPLTLYLGFNLDNKLDLWNTSTTTLTNIIHTHSWTASTTLGLGLLANWDWTRHSLRIHHNLPIIGAFSHSSFSDTILAFTTSTPDTTPDFLNRLLTSLPKSTTAFSWEKAFYSSLDITYEWKMTQWMGLVFHYGLTLEYSRSLENSLALETLHQQLNLGISLFW